jgi:aryl-phospho-beta-D-glucosidase BglC (GH1 family)
MLGTANRLTLTDVKTRVDRFGWESCAHAQLDANHGSTYTGLTAATLEADLRAQRAWQLANGIRGGDGTAYPLGQFGKTSDGQSTTDIVRRYFAWARTTANRTRETFPPAGIHRLRAISSISTFTGGVTPTSLTTTTTGTIDKAKTNAAWLILVFHKIATTTPAATTEVLQSDFNAIIDKINSTGMPVMTVGDVLRYQG